MNISNAISLMLKGKYVARRKWPERTYIFLDGDVIKYSSLGIDSLWQPSHQDLLKSDYKEIIPER